MMSTYGLALVGALGAFAATTGAVGTWVEYTHATDSSMGCYGYCENGFDPDYMCGLGETCCGAYNCEEKTFVVKCCGGLGGTMCCDVDFSTDPPKVSCVFCP